MMTELSNEDLSMVSGGNDADIKVDIKTLPGDNDDYKIALSDTIDKKLMKYSQEKKL